MDLTNDQLLRHRLAMGHHNGRVAAREMPMHLQMSVAHTHPSAQYPLLAAREAQQLMLATANQSPYLINPTSALAHNPHHQQMMYHGRAADPYLLRRQVPMQTVQLPVATMHNPHQVQLVHHVAAPSMMQTTPLDLLEQHHQQQLQQRAAMFAAHPPSSAVVSMMPPTHAPGVLVGGAGLSHNSVEATVLPPSLTPPQHVAGLPTSSAAAAMAALLAEETPEDGALPEAIARRVARAAIAKPYWLENNNRNQGERPLPDNFYPGPNAVIIGRKKQFYTSMGNLRLRDVVLLCLPAYSKCTKKKEKTDIVTGVVEMIRDACDGEGAFCKCDHKGQWFEVSELIARERVASIFRDFLSDQYRSSSKQKVKRRRERKAEQKQLRKKEIARKRLEENNKQQPQLQEVIPQVAESSRSIAKQDQEDSESSADGSATESEE